MSNRCKNCKRWQGTICSTEGDCNWVVALVYPGITDAKYYDDNRGRMVHFPLPFDPHYHKEWMQVSEEYRKAMKHSCVPSGMRIDSVDGINFIVTHKDYSCTLYKPKG